MRRLLSARTVALADIDEHSLHTNTAWNAQPPTDDENNSAASDGESDSSLDLSTKTKRPIQTQSRLGGTFTKSSGSATASGSTSKRPRLKPGTPRATLVVAPMTLLSQWCDELERSSRGGKMRVLMYYGNKRESGADLLQEIDEGVDVVVTRYARCTSNHCGGES